MHKLSSLAESRHLLFEIMLYGVNFLVILKAVGSHPNQSEYAVTLVHDWPNLIMRQYFC